MGRGRVTNAPCTVTSSSLPPQSSSSSQSSTPCQRMGLSASLSWCLTSQLAQVRVRYGFPRESPRLTALQTPHPHSQTLRRCSGAHFAHRRSCDCQVPRPHALRDATRCAGADAVRHLGHPRASGVSIAGATSSVAATVMPNSSSSEEKTPCSPLLARRSNSISRIR